MNKPYAPASERNQGPILDVLRDHLADRKSVLEIGSGTGQHAVYFARALPHLTWQASDVPAHLAGIKQWLDEARLANAPPALSFDINGEPPAASYDVVFTANTLHIMGWGEVERTFATLPRLLNPGALFVAYGPFKREGRFSGSSDAAFDQSLRAADAKRGIRDIEAVDALAQAAGLTMIEDRAMPANNRCVVWSAA